MLFHKKARKHRWDVEKYNRIKQGINTVELDLQKIRDPLQIQSRQPRRVTRAWELEEDSLGSTTSGTSSASFNEEKQYEPQI
eukprot:UN12284